MISKIENKSCFSIKKMYHSIQFNQIFSVPDTILSSILGITDIITTTLLFTGWDILKIILTSYTAVVLMFM